MTSQKHSFFPLFIVSFLLGAIFLSLNSGDRPKERKIPFETRKTATFSPQVQSQDLPNVFVMAPRSVRRPLTLAEEAIADGNFAEAVNLLGTVMIGTGTEDYFLPPEEGDGTLMSVKNRALEMIGELPPRGREVYQLRFGVEAETTLEEAVAERDYAKVSLVAQRYFHTEAGYQAMVLLGRFHLDHGRYLQASRCFLSTFEQVETIHPLFRESGLMASMSLALSGRRKDAEEVITQIASAGPRQRLELGSDTVQLDNATQENVSAVFDELSALIGTLPPSATADALTQWCLLGGSPERNAIGAGGVPLLRPLWRVPVNDADDEETVNLVAQEFDGEKLAAFPGVLPLAINDFIIMRSPNKVIGVDIRTGKRKWLYPWDDDFFGVTPNQSINSIVGSNARQHQLKQRLWEDSVYGRMTSNGQALYFVDGLGYATANRVSGVQDPGALGFAGQVRVRAFSSRDVNHLVALQLTDEEGRAIEGKLTWRVGDEDGLDEPALAGMFFLGPPLPLDGRLYALGESKGEIQLIVLDEQTGKLEWSQQLAIVEEVGGIQISAMRRLAGATPSYGEGVLLCPTAAGAIVAVDPSTRSLMWGYQFATRTRTSGSTIASNSFQSETKRPGEKWFDGSVIVSDGYVLMTPVESTSMYCLELRTGKLVWKESVNRDDSISVIGVRDGQAIIVGAHTVKSVSLEDASVTWSLDLAEYGRPSGRGYLDSDYVCFPTADRKLLMVDISNGEVMKQVQCERVLGNLISVNGRIISHGYDYVATYYQDRAARTEASRLLAKDPSDPDGLALQGQIQLLDGEWDAAVDSLAKCYEVDPSDEHAELLITSLLKGLREDEPRALELIEPFEALVLSSTSRAQFLQLQVERMVESNQFDLAFEHLLALLFENPDVPIDFSLEQINREGRYVRQDRWVQTVMTRILQYASPTQLQTIEARLDDLENELMQDNSTQSLTRFQSMFGVVAASEVVDLRIARDAYEADDLLPAMTTYHRLKSSEDALVAGQAVAGLALCYAKSGYKEPAGHYVARLAGEFGEIKCWDDQLGPDVADVVNDMIAARTSLTGQMNWPIGEIDVDETGDFIGNNVFPLEYSRVHEEQAQHDGLVPLRVDHDRKNEAVIRDELGRAIASIPMRQNSNTPPYYGSTLLTSKYLRKNELMVLVSGYDVIGVDLTQLASGAGASVRWRHSLLPDLLIDSSNRTSKQRVSKKGYIGPLGWSVQFAVDTSFQRLGAISPISDRGICYLKRGQLICIDPLSGDVLWKRSDLQHGSDVFGTDEFVAVVDRDYSQSRVFRLTDGQEIAQHPLNGGRNALTSHQASLLSFDSNGTEIKMQIVDVVTGETRWEESYEIGTRAASVDREHFATLNRDGELTIRSLLNGEVTLSTQLMADDAIQSFRVIQRPGQLLVCTNRNGSSVNTVTLGRPNNTKIFVPNQMGNLVHGNIFALDPESGEQVWDGPAWIEQFCLPTRQTPGIPIMPLVRHHPARTERGNVAQTHTELVVLDLRDGRLITHRDDIPQTTRMMHVSAGESTNSATIVLNEKTFELVFSDRPREEAEPADTAFREEDTQPNE